MRVRNRLDGLWCDEDFAGWYLRDGHPGPSPALPQFLLALSNRQAAEAVRCRIDLTQHLAMEPNDPGFHHSAMADFREHLAQDDRADPLPDLALALARLKDAGLASGPGACRRAPRGALAPRPGADLGNRVEVTAIGRPARRRSPG